MKTFIKITKWLTIALFLAISLTAAAPAPDFSPANAFKEACTLSRYDCTNLPAPRVRYSTIVTTARAYGIFAGGNTVWLAPGLAPELQYVVLVHETVHYLQYHVDGVKIPFPSMFAKCVAEEEAYIVSDIVAARFPSTQFLIRSGNTASYGCAE